MKNIYLKFLLVLAISGASSCENALNIAPTDFIAPEYYYKNEAQLNQALVGVYEVLGRGLLYQAVGYSVVSAFNCTDEMFTISSMAAIPQKYDYNSSFEGVYDLWRHLYIGVEKSNMLLENINKPEMDEIRRNDIKGQAQFLRAFYFFLLVSNYGDIPLRLNSTASVNDVNAANTPAKEIYEFIIREMEEAEGLVKPISAYNHAGRITQSAIQGILARVYLYKAGFPNNDPTAYAGALKWSTKLIESGLHALLPDYSKLFVDLIQDKYNTSENIWEVEFYSTGAADIYGKRGGLGQGMGINQTNVNLGYSTGQYGVHAALFYKYEEADLRRDWNVAAYGYRGSNTLERVYWTPAEIYNRRIGKYRREYELTEQKVSQYTSTNFPVLRYSDVLLMAAEAENEINGPTPKAIGWINQVRRRAYGNGNALKSVDIINGGSGFTTAPVVTITGGGAVNASGVDPASAVATIENGKITGIKVVNRGTFYTSAPNVSISGGGGSGATATALLAPPADAHLPAVQTSGKEVFRQALMDERARELCFEGMRRNDLIRWGSFVPVMKALADQITLNAPASFKAAALAGQNISERNNYIPIPLRELTLNNLLVQTPGW